MRLSYRAGALWEYASPNYVDNPTAMHIVHVAHNLKVLG